MGIISGLLENTNDIYYIWANFCFIWLSIFKVVPPMNLTSIKKPMENRHFYTVLQRLLHYLLCGAELLLFVLQIASQQYGHEY